MEAPLLPEHREFDARRWRDAYGALFAAGIAVSVVVHVVLTAAALQQFASVGAVGGGGAMRDAIGVDIVAAAVLDRRETPAPIETSAAPARTVADVDGAMAEPRQAAMSPSQPAPVAPAEAVQDSMQPAMHPAHDPVRAEPAPTPRQTEQPIPQSPAPPVGGVASRGADGLADASAKAAASPGAVQRYSIAISQALERAKLSQAPPARRGRVIVTFALTPEGDLAAVHIAEASGDVLVDAAALRLFRRATFPAPPPGALRSDLTYTVPIEFR